MSYEESLEELGKILFELQEANTTIPIIVEGAKDIRALRRLNMPGELIKVNTGESLANFCDLIAEQYTNVILLLDWDRKGGFLCGNILKNLEGRVHCNTLFRERIARTAIIKKVEGLPSYLHTLKEKTNHL